MPPKHPIASALLTLAAMSAQAQAPEPKLDLDKAVENPALVRAIERLATDTSDPAKDQLIGELQQSEFLAALLPDDGKTVFAGPPGATVVSKGARFGVLASAKDGRSYLILFTDWAQLRTYSNKNVTGWVLPAHDAWAFALQNGFDGIVVNPAHNALPLGHAALEYLATRLAK